jgi:acetyltransferase-like isoleucine patch superfamily enzyme
MNKRKPQLKNLPRFLKKPWFWFIATRFRNSVILHRFFISRVRIWRMTGCHIGKNVRIGLDVYYDVDNAGLIHIEDNVWIASRCLLLCHRRDMKQYYKGDEYMDLPYMRAPVTLKKGCCISMDSIVFPGVTVGEGAVVGAGSVVVKDVPAWSVVAGNPAKIIYMVKEREDE